MKSFASWICTSRHYFHRNGLDQVNAQKIKAASLLEKNRIKKASAMHALFAFNDVHQCLMNLDGFLNCWSQKGKNKNNINQRLKLNNNDAFFSITSNKNYICGIKKIDTTLWCGTISAVNEETEIAVTFLEPIRSVTLNQSRYGWIKSAIGCVILEKNGHVQCWGNHPEINFLYVPADLGAVLKVIAFGSGACAIKADDHLQCWKFKEALNFPLRPSKALGALSALMSNNRYMCAIKKQNKELVCWLLYNESKGVLPLPDLGPVVTLAIGEERFESVVCALKQVDKKITCFIIDNKKYVHKDHSYLPPDDLGEVIDVSAGKNYFCALKKINGKVACWGYQSAGKIVVPSDLKPLISIKSKNIFTCGLTEKKDLRCWKPFWSKECQERLEKKERLSSFPMEPQWSPSADQCDQEFLLFLKQLFHI